MVMIGAFETLASLPSKQGLKPEAVLRDVPRDSPLSLHFHQNKD